METKTPKKPCDLRLAGPWERLTLSERASFPRVTGHKPLLVAVMSGRMTVATEAYGEKTVEARQMFVVPAKARYLFTADSAALVLVCEFDMALLETCRYPVRRLMRRAAKCYPLFCTVEMSADACRLLEQVPAFMNAAQNATELPLTARQRFFATLRSGHRTRTLAWLMRPVLMAEYE